MHEYIVIMASALASATSGSTTPQASPEAECRPRVIVGDGAPRPAAISENARCLSDTAPSDPEDNADAVVLIPRERSPYDLGYAVPSEDSIKGATRSLRVDLAWSYDELQLVDEVDRTLALSARPTARFGREGGWIAEGEFRFSRRSLSGAGGINPLLEEIDETSFDRGPLSLTRDFPELSSRLRLGDLAPRRQNFQGGARILGASFGSANQELFPFRSVVPTDRRSFFLERPSSVQIYAGGQLVREDRLQPGQYDLAALSEELGNRRVQLIVRDNLGQETRLDFARFNGVGRLANGIVEHGLYAGVPATLIGEGFEYGNDLVAGGFYRRGLSDLATVGGDFQVAYGAAQIGGQLALAGSWGALGVGAAVSVDDGATGGALRLDYQTTELEGLPTLLLDATLHSAEFVAPLQPITRFPVWEVNAGVDWSPTSRIGLSAGIGSRRERALFGSTSSGQELETWAAFGTARWDLGRGRFVAVTMTDSPDPFGAGRDQAVFFELRFRLRDDQSVRASWTDTDNASSAVWSRTELRGVDDWSGQVRVNRSGAEDPRTTAAAEASWSSNRFVAYGAWRGQIDGPGTQSRALSARIDSSIGYADGRWALGRPGGGPSFVIVDRPAGLQSGQDVYVDWVGPADYRARTGALGPALVGDVRPMNNEPVRISVVDSATDAETPPATEVVSVFLHQAAGARIAAERFSGLLER